MNISKHILIITAHPHPDWFTHHIADRYQFTSQQCGHEVQYINLYESHRKQSYLMVDKSNKSSLDPETTVVQQEIHTLITWADELVFVFPLWWCDCPAIMKNFWDVNMSSGFAFRYKKNSLLPHQLLKGKTVRIFLTAGAQSWILRTVFLWHLVTWYVARCMYVGMRLKSYTTFWSLSTRRSQKQRDKMLKIVENIANRGY